MLYTVERSTDSALRRDVITCLELGPSANSGCGCSTHAESVRRRNSAQVVAYGPYLPLLDPERTALLEELYWHRENIAPPRNSRLAPQTGHVTMARRVSRKHRNLVTVESRISPPPSVMRPSTAPCGSEQSGLRQHQSERLTTQPLATVEATRRRSSASRQSAAPVHDSANIGATIAAGWRSGLEQTIRHTDGTESIGSRLDISLVAHLAGLLPVEVSADVAEVTVSVTQSLATDAAGRRRQAGSSRDRSSAAAHPSTRAPGDAFLTRPPPAGDEHPQFRQTPHQRVPPLRSQDPRRCRHRQSSILQHRECARPQQVGQQSLGLSMVLHSGSSQRSQSSPGSSSLVSSCATDRVETEENASPLTAAAPLGPSRPDHEE